MSTTVVPTDKSQMTREEINRKQKEYIFPSVSTYYSDPLPMDHASMQHVWDVEGKKYLDFFGGIVTISVGHCNPRVTSRTKEQIDRMQHVSTCFPNVPMVDLAEKLAQITPGALKKSYFTNSGTEANETAIQVARMHTGNFEVVALRHGYSGRSSLTRGPRASPGRATSMDRRSRRGAAAIPARPTAGAAPMRPRHPRSSARNARPCGTARA